MKIKTAEELGITDQEHELLQLVEPILRNMADCVLLTPKQAFAIRAEIADGDHLENSDVERCGFRMNALVDYTPDDKCNTYACIAGWMQVVSHGEWNIRHSSGVLEDMFWPSGWVDSDEKFTSQIAADGIKRFLEGGGIYFEVPDDDDR